MTMNPPLNPGIGSYAPPARPCRVESDILADFLEDAGVVFAPQLAAKKAELFQRYQSWTSMQNVKPLTSREFGQIVASRPGVRAEKGRADGDRVWYWRGVGLPPR
jgi:hypothetical protein